AAPRVRGGGKAPPQGVGVAVRAVEDHVVVELGVAGQADLAPALNQRLQSQFGSDRRLDGPGGDQAAVQGAAVEGLDLGAALDDQPLDDVEAVRLGPGSGDVGQVPAFGRRGPAGPLAAVQSSTAAKDAVDGSHRGQFGQPLLLERLPDDLGTDGPQVTACQVLADLQNQ